MYTMITNNGLRLSLLRVQKLKLQYCVLIINCDYLEAEVMAIEIKTNIEQ